MIGSVKPWVNQFKLVITDKNCGDAKTIEFSAPDPHAALVVLERQGEGREVQMFENDRPLGTIQQVAGYWRISRGMSR
jgi:hypothetical protein